MRKNFMAPSMGGVQLCQGCRTTTLQGESFLFTSKFPGVPGANFIDFRRIKGLEHVYMRPEVNSNRFEISRRGNISLRCEVTSLSAFT